MWRHEPVAGDHMRTDLLLQLRTIRSRVEQLEARLRSGTLDERAADGEIRRLGRRLDVLGVHWPS